MLGAGADVFAVWSWVIANAGPKGILEINPALLAAMIGEPVEAIETALAFLQAPDPRSRSDAEQGRRLIHEGAFTYRVVNHAQYRAARDAEERREYKRNKQREYRARNCPQVSTVDNVDRRSPKTEAEAEGRRQKTEFSPSELASEPTENAHPHSAPTQPPDPAGTLPPTGKASASLGASSQASKAVSVAKRKPSRRKPSVDAIRIAQHLYQAISAHSPDMFGSDSSTATEKRLLGWTVEIDRGLKAKDITVEDAILIVDYAHHIDDPAGSNGFSWHTNLLSGVAMRKQWKKKALLGKARRWRDGKGQGQGALGGKQAASDFIENDDYDYAAAAERNRRMGIGI
jgi:hypothetical protein